MLNDGARMSAWESGIQQVVTALASNNTGLSSKNRTIVDLSDGSVLSLIAAATIKKRFRVENDTENEYPLQVVSLERKDFSRMFSAQLCTGNEFNDVLEVVDLETWREMKHELLAGTSTVLNNSFSINVRVEHYCAVMCCDVM